MKLSIQMGEIYGSLTILSETIPPMHGYPGRRFLCRCICGQEVIVRLSQLRSGTTKSCGCIRKRNIERGIVFGRLTIVREENEDQHHRRFFCQCICGGTVIASLGNLVTGEVRSCGCLKRERVLAMNAEKATHRLSKHPLYDIWRQMLARCTDPKNPGWARYGGRGIAVCAEWQKGPTGFIEWAKVHGWQHSLELDRRDNDGPYSPANCRFVTREQNQNNKRTNAFVMISGEKMTLAEARKFGMSERTLRRMPRVSTR